MATRKQHSAARRNIKKAQQRWRGMTKRQHALAQPEGRSRKLPGTTGKGRFYRIEVRPKGQFTSFRNQDVGKRGGLERLAGRRTSGSWDTVSWLVEKSKARRAGNTLVITDSKAKTALKQIRGPIRHVKGDVFRAHPRRNVPERAKPTVAERRARIRNIKKARAARRR
jgi:hypothetical protein